MKQSAILELDTPDSGLISGHQDCHAYLERSVRDLLGPVRLDSDAQEQLLEETDEVFNEDDRRAFSCEPSLREVKESVWRANHLASPGTDGIISLFYKAHW